MQANVGKNNLMPIRFKNRNATNQSDKGIAEQYNQGGPFDVELQTIDGKSVSAHRFVMVTFSKEWANTLRSVGVDGVISVPIAVPYNVAKKLVELLYMREIFVLEDEKQPILDALKLLKISGIDDGSKVQMQVPTQQFAQPNGVPAKITQQRRATVAMDSYTPGKRTLQRSQSTYPDPSIRQNNMLPPQSPSQRPPPSTNIGSNPNRNSTKMTEMKLPSQVSLTKIPRSMNANGGQARQQPLQQQQQQQGQMIAQNRQSTQQNQMAVLNQLQKCGVTVKMPNPTTAQKPMAAPSPPPQKSATQIQSKLPAGVSLKQTRNNQQSQHQQQQQQQQQLLARTAQAQSAISIIPTSSMNHAENAAAKNGAPASAAVAQNGQIGTIIQNDEIDNLPIDMDETIGNGKTNDEQDNGVEKVNNGGDENQSKLNNGMDNPGIEETVTNTAINNDIEHQNQDPFDDENRDDEFNDDFEGYDDNMNYNNAKHHELRDILSDMQDNVTQ